MFSAKMADADAEATETQVWLDFAFECAYIREDVHKQLIADYEQLGKMLGKMIAEARKFTPA